jgi:hypothetical protein
MSDVVMGELTWSRVTGKRRWQATRTMLDRWITAGRMERPRMLRTILIAEVRKHEGAYEVRMFREGTLIPPFRHRDTRDVITICDSLPEAKAAVAAELAQRALEAMT